MALPRLRDVWRGPARANPTNDHRDLIILDVEPSVVRRKERVAPEQVGVRMAKREALRAAGVDPYPPAFDRTHLLGDIRAEHYALPPNTRTGQRVSVAGRVMRLRDHGGLCFATLRDWSGGLQVIFERCPEFARWVDLGAHVGVGGEIGTSRRGEVSVFADAWQLTAKCLHPLPDKHRGMADPEALVRHRHVDLIVNAPARAMVRTRSRITFALRSVLHERGFLEAVSPLPED